MPKFIYKAKDSSAEIVTGIIETETRDIAVRKIAEKGYFPIDVYEQVSSGGDFVKKYFKRIKKSHIVTFTRQMADLIDSGIPIFKSLIIIKEQTENVKLRNIIEDVANKVREGKELSVSLAEYPNIFSNLYVALVKSGELGGNLDSVLLHLADLLEKEDDLKSRVRAAMAYPLLMVIVGIITVAILVMWVIPKLLYMFEEIGQVLPLPTKILLGASNLFSEFWWVIVVFIISIILIYKKIVKSNKGRIYIDEIKLKIPVFKHFIVKREIARFTRTLGTLLNSGVEMISSFEVTVGIINNKIIQQQLSKIILQIQEGGRLTDGLKQIKQFPLLIPNMVAVGEESGHLDKILLKIANNYDRELDYTIKTMTNLLEPIIILVMGLIVGFIVISVLLPIFTIDFSSW